MDENTGITGSFSLDNLKDKQPCPRSLLLASSLRDFYLDFKEPTLVTKNARCYYCKNR
ncbi:hypothetical protein [Candidatus Nitrospira salsa]